MDAEKIKRGLQKSQDVLIAAARHQAPLAIGLAAVALHERGLPVSTQALVDALLAPLHGRQPKDLLRVEHEEAARLLGWRPTPTNG